MYAGEHVKHAIKRTYSNWKGASGTFFAQLRTQTEGEEGLDLTVYQRAQARAVQLFKMIDTDGSGVMLHPLRTIAPSFPPPSLTLISVSFPSPFFSHPLVSTTLRHFSLSPFFLFHREFRGGGHARFCFSGVWRGRSKPQS